MIAIMFFLANAVFAGLGFASVMAGTATTLTYVALALNVVATLVLSVPAYEWLTDQ